MGGNTTIKLNESVTPEVADVEGIEQSTNGTIPIPTLHAVWLSSLMSTPEFDKLVADKMKESPNAIFHHVNMAKQLQHTIAEEIRNKTLTEEDNYSNGKKTTNAAD